MQTDNLGGGDRLVMKLGFVLLLIHLHCGRVTCFHDSIFDYVSFEETGEWNTVYSQTCGGRSNDDYREPRHLQFPENLRPPWESKTPVKINTKEVVRKENDNLTLYVFSNAGVRGGYSVSYGFQRNKECMHGYDDHCVVHRSFGNIRALVLNGERFKEGQNLNYIKDHFLIEDPEQLVTIINAGSPYERKFYEAIFLGGYMPTAFQNRGRSSHVIDGKSYPMEIYMYFVDEATPSMSLATILVVLVEESDRDNPFIKPIVTTVETKLYDEERRRLHNDVELFRRQRTFHNQEASLKYDIFAKHKKKTEEQIRQERFKSSGRMEEDIVGQTEIYERMEALEYQLFVLDEDLEHAKESFARAEMQVEIFEKRVNGTADFPYEHDDLWFIAGLGNTMGEIPIRKKYYEQYFHTSEYFGYVKNVYDVFTETEWFEKGAFEGLLEALGAEFGKLTKSDDTKFFRMVYEYINDSTRLNSTEKTRLMKLGFAQLKNITFHVTVHCQKYVNWVSSNRNATYMKGISDTEKYRLIKEYQELMAKKRVLNEDVYNHFFANDSFIQRAFHEWDVLTAIPDFRHTYPVEEKKHSVIDSVHQVLEGFFRKFDYTRYLKKTVLLLQDLVKSQHFPDEKTMRDVLHYHKFGYKDLDMKKRREYLHNAFYTRNLPSQEKRRGFVEMGNMEMSKEDNREEMKANPLKVKVEEAFQVSWLIPPNGGYYYYSGSSPVPPCYRAQNVIVFKKPITMSKYQIKMLTKVPISFNTKSDIVHTTPVLHETKFRIKLQNGPLGQMRYEDIVVPVYDQPRNHLFLGHDGVHKNSVEEYELRLQKRNGAKQIKSDSSTNSQTAEFRIIWSLIIGFYLTHVL